MAPWPEQGNEPKAPDKDEKRELVDVNAKVDLDDSSESTISAKSDQKTDEKEVLTLDEGQLKALLDEAITYKNPKDREGKSELFKELLQEAEADESDSKGLGGSLGGKLPRAYYNLPVRRRQSRHGGQSRECGVGVSTTRGGSLQNLHALGMEGGRRSRKRDTLVSARQREGGSLPTNVNVDNDPDLDMICTNYTSRATLEVSGHKKEENASKEEPNALTFLKVQGHHYLPNGMETQNTKEDENRVVETVYASSIKQNKEQTGQNNVEDSGKEVDPPHDGDNNVNEETCLEDKPAKSTICCSCVNKSLVDVKPSNNVKPAEGNETRKCACRNKMLKNVEPLKDVDPPKYYESSQAETSKCSICHNKSPRGLTKPQDDESSNDEEPPEDDQAPLDDEVQSYEFYNSKFPILFCRPDGSIEIVECVVVDPYKVLADEKAKAERNKKNNKRPPTPGVISEPESGSKNLDTSVKKSSEKKQPQKKTEKKQNQQNKKKDNIKENSTSSIKGKNVDKENSCLSKEPSRVVHSPPKINHQTSKVNFLGEGEKMLKKSDRAKSGCEFCWSQLLQNPSSRNKDPKYCPCCKLGLKPTVPNDRAKTEGGNLPNNSFENKSEEQNSETPLTSDTPSKIKDETSGSCSLVKSKSSKEKDSETVPPSRRNLPTIRRLSAIERRALVKKVPVKHVAAAEERKGQNQGVGPVESGAMLYPSTPVQHVSVLSIPPSQIHAGSDDHRISDSSEAKKLNVSRSRQHKKGHPTEETDNTSEGLLGLPLTAYWNRYSSFTLLDFQGMSRGVCTRPIYTARGIPKFEPRPIPYSCRPFSLPDAALGERRVEEQPEPIYTPSNPLNLPLSIPDCLRPVQSTSSREDPDVISHFIPITGTPSAEPLAAKKKNKKKSKAAPTDKASAVSTPSLPVPGSVSAAPPDSKKRNKKSRKAANTATKDSSKPTNANKKEDDGAITPPRFLIFQNPYCCVASSSKEPMTEDPLAAASHSSDSQGLPPLPTPELLQAMLGSAKKRLEDLTQGNPPEFPLPSLLSDPALKRRKMRRDSSIPFLRETKGDSRSLLLPDKPPAAAAVSKKSNRRTSKATPPVSSGDSSIPFLRETKDVPQSLPLPDKPPVAPPAGKRRNRRRSKGTPPASTAVSDIPLPVETDVVSRPLPVPDMPLEVPSVAMKGRSKTTTNAEELAIPSQSFPTPDMPPARKKKTRIDWTGLQKCTLCPIDEESGESCCMDNDCDDSSLPHLLPVSPTPPFPSDRKKITNRKRFPKPSLSTVQEHPDESCSIESEESDEECPELIPITPLPPSSPSEIMENRRSKVTPSTAEDSGIPTPSDTDVVSQSLPVPDMPPVHSPSPKKRNRIDWTGQRKCSLCPIEECSEESCCAMNEERDDSSLPQFLPVPPTSPLPSPGHRKKKPKHGKRFPKPPLSTIQEHLEEPYSIEGEKSDEECPEPVPNPLAPPLSSVKNPENRPTTGEPLEEEPYVPQGPPFPTPEYIADLERCRDRLEMVTKDMIAERAARKKKEAGRSKTTPSTRKVSVIPTPRGTDVVSQSLPVPDMPPVVPPAAKKKNRRKSKSTPTTTRPPVAPIPTETSEVSHTLPVPDRPPVVPSSTNESRKPPTRDRLLISYSPDPQGIPPLPTPEFLQDMVDKAKKLIPTPRETDVVSQSLPVPDMPPVVPPAAKKESKGRSKTTATTTRPPVAPRPRETIEVSRTLPVPDRPPLVPSSTNKSRKPPTRDRLLISYSPDPQGIPPLPTPEFLQDMVDKAKKLIPTPRGTDVSQSLPVPDMPPVVPPAAKKESKGRSKTTPTTTRPPVAPRETSEVSQTLPVPDRPPVPSSTNESRKPTSADSDRLLMSYSLDPQGVTPPTSPALLQDMYDKARKRFEGLLQIHCPELASVPQNPPLLTESEFKGRKSERTPPVFTEDPGIPFLGETDEVPIPPLFSEGSRIPFLGENNDAPQSLPLPERSPVNPPASNIRSSESTLTAESEGEEARPEPHVCCINPNYNKGLTERAKGDANTRLAFGNTADGKTKPLDENGNALACVRMDSNCLDRKKQRRVKAKNDRNTILSDEIEGFRGAADIDTLMEYIESPSLDSNKSNKARTNQANGTRNSVKVRAKEEEPRSIKRRKDKFQRCNSLEEISKTKLEDLTEEGSSERVNGSSHPLTKKQVTLDDAELGKKSSWEEVVETARVYETKDQKQERISPEPVQDSEFHVVTKKQRKKKRRTGCSSRGGSKQDYYSGREGGSGRLLYQYRRDEGTSQPRRKSASSVPPSDKSDSSDLDSVHSLPVSSSAARTRVGQNSVSGGSTPQASYADIARTAASPPDGSQVNIDRHERCSANSSFTESYERTSTIPNPMLPMPLASFKKDAMTDTNCDNSPLLTSEDYPPLEVRTPDFCTETVQRSRSGARDNSVTTDRAIIKTDPVIPGRESGDGPQSLPTDFMCVKTSDTSSNKRPPVILMHDPSRGDSRVPEIQFGFPVNYQLLQSEDIECNETVDSPPQPPIPALPTPAPIVRDQGAYSFIQDQNLVQYLSATWEEAMDKVRSGKARYYDGQ